MSAPPDLTPTLLQPGGSTPSRTGSHIELAIRAAHRVMLDCGVQVSPRKVNRIIRQFDQTSRRHGHSFHEFLTNQANMPTAAVRKMFAHPEWAPVIAYCDPTGETAVNNVMRGRHG